MAGQSTDDATCLIMWRGIRLKSKNNSAGNHIDSPFFFCGTYLLCTEIRVKFLLTACLGAPKQNLNQFVAKGRGRTN